MISGMGHCFILKQLKEIDYKANFSGYKFMLNNSIYGRGSLCNGCHNSRNFNISFKLNKSVLDDYKNLIRVYYG
jgi:hypothetical protein